MSGFPDPRPGDDATSEGRVDARTSPAPDETAAVAVSAGLETGAVPPGLETGAVPPGLETGAVRPLMVLGDPGAAICDGDVCSLPSV